MKNSGAVLLAAGLAVGAIGGFFAGRGSPEAEKPPTLVAASSPAVPSTPPQPQTTAVTPPTDQPTSSPQQPLSLTTLGLPPSLDFLRLAVERGQTPGTGQNACFHFSGNLRPDADYSSFISVEPAAKPAVRVVGQSLCLAGLPRPKSTVTLLKGLPGDSDKTLAQDAQVQVDFGPSQPSVSFAGNGYVLPRLGTSGVVLQVAGVREIEMQVLRVGDRMLSREANEEFPRANLYAWDVNRIAEDRGAIVWKGVMSVPQSDSPTPVAFPLADALKERKPGAYLIVATPLVDGKVPDSDEWGRRATQWIIDTDLAMTSYRGSDGLTVALRSLASAKPVVGADLQLIAINNEVLGTAKSDGEGLVRFPAALMNGSGGNAPASLFAFGGDKDFALLDLRRPSFDLSDRGVAGRTPPGNFDAFFYADRGIYRPGETIHLSALLRDIGSQAAEKQSMWVEIRRPNGSVFRAEEWPATAGGGQTHAIELPGSAPRGLWSVSAYLHKNGPQIGGLEVDVQDFVPQKLKVAAEIAPTRPDASEPLMVDVAADFLYGAPAPDMSVEVSANVFVDNNPFDGATNWAIGKVEETFEPQTVNFEVPATDAQGKAQAVGNFDALPPSGKPLRASITATVFEPGGRPVHAMDERPLRTRPLWLAIRKLGDGGWVPEDADSKLDIAAFDPDGNRLEASGLRWRLVKEYWNYRWYRRDGDWRYTVDITDRVLDIGTGTTKPTESLSIARKFDWGHYRLEVEDPRSGAQASYKFRAGWGSTQDDSDTPDKLTVEVDKPRYAAGETARLKITPPAAGEVQIVIASDRVHLSRTVSVAAGGAVVDIPTDPSWTVGAYALVSYLHPLDTAKPGEPVRAVGVAWIGIDQGPKQLQLAMNAPEKVLPESLLTVPLKIDGVQAGETVRLTLAAVDEGILQLTQFASPNPDEHFLSKRRMALTMRDDYGRLLTGKAGLIGQIREGGDGMGGAGLAQVPTRTVALFEGPVQVGADGTAEVKFEVPDFVGQLRLMAVAWSGKRVGQAEGRVFVRQPLVADAGFPRFLAPRDEGRVTLSLHNLEAPEGKYKIRMSAEGAVTLGAPYEKELDLARDARVTERIALIGKEIGLGTVALSVEGPNGYGFKRSWPIQVRTPFYPLTLEQVASQSAGAKFTLDPTLLLPFEAGSVKLAINYSPFKGVDVPGLLQSLDRYPYGCTEQITSRALPLLLTSDLSAAAGLGAGKDADALKLRVAQAIETVTERMDEGGRPGLWRPGDGYADLWVVSQAIDFLWMAKQAGYSVPEATLNLGLDYLGRRFSDAHPSHIAYARYVRARAGKADPGDLRALYDTSIDKMPGALPRAMMGASLALIGDTKRSAGAFVASERVLGLTRWQATNDDGYATSVREAAGALALAIQAKASNLEVFRRKVESLTPAPERNTTQEKLWLLRAASAMAAGPAPRISANDIIPAGGMNGAVSFRPTPAEVQQGYSLTNQGTDSVFRTLVVTGAPKEAPPPLSAGYTLTKSYFTLQGDTLDPAQLTQHDRLIVSLAGTVKDAARHQSLLVDLLPAGWEIESILSLGSQSQDGEEEYVEEEGAEPPPRLYAFLPDTTPTVMREARDDRFVASMDLKGGADQAFHAAYVVRAVTPGHYVLPGAVIEDMYRSGVMARSGAASTTVGQK
ncbi:alpha-2-macroglobulin [Lacibacterium aquatile]|uniref:Alpha-2-macroglobulin n=1 Tax=Lacibacterium aquatile TaxID=1168082 RepID=A0ABW5DTI9_9PROT